MVSVPINFLKNAPKVLSSYSAVLTTPIGKVGLVLADASLTEIDFLPPSFPAIAPLSSLAGEIAEQLNAYFTTSDFTFSLPLAPHGTPFQRRVWSALLGIDAGQTQTYGRLAAELKSSARAVGGGCRANPIPIVIPCHRVVASAGLGGFMGQRVGESFEMKRWLLAHEKVQL